MLKFLFALLLLSGASAWSKDDSLALAVQYTKLFPTVSMKIKLLKSMQESKEAIELLKKLSSSAEKINLNYDKDFISFNHSKTEGLKVVSENPLVLAYKGKSIPWDEKQSSEQNLKKIISFFKLDQKISTMNLFFNLAYAKDKDSIDRSISLAMVGVDAWLIYLATQSIKHGAFGYLKLARFTRIGLVLVLLLDAKDVVASDGRVPNKVCNMSGTNELKNSTETLRGLEEEKITFSENGQPQEQRVYLDGQLISRVQFNFNEGDPSAKLFGPNNVKQDELEKDSQKSAFDGAMQIISTCRNPETRAELIKETEEYRKKILAEASLNPAGQSSRQKDGEKVKLKAVK